MSEEQAGDLSSYSGDGTDLSEEQRKYLADHAAHQPAAGDKKEEAAAKSLADNPEGEFA